jgi:putative ABC transport system permease protein
MMQGYLPFLQRPGRNMGVVIKTTIDPYSILNTARELVLQIDPGQPISGARTMKELKDNSIAPARLNLGLLGTFAGLALVLAFVGIYGVLAFIVAQRQREIGVRVALGAQRHQVLGLIVGQGVRLLGIGVVVGLLGSFALTRVLTSILFGVAPMDPSTFSVVTALLYAIGLLACWLPARRAAKVDPMAALRQD